MLEKKQILLLLLIKNLKNGKKPPPHHPITTTHGVSKPKLDTDTTAAFKCPDFHSSLGLSLN